MRLGIDQVRGRHEKRCAGQACEKIAACGVDVGARFKRLIEMGQGFQASFLY